MYDKELPGVVLTLDQVKGLSNIEESYCGFFLSTHIDRVLENSNCVGMRIYKSQDASNNPNLYGRGVLENGLEIQDSVLVSVFNGPSNLVLNVPAIQGSNERTIEDVSKTVEDVSKTAKEEFDNNQGRGMFSSFFSRTMLENLRSDAASGVSFYNRDFSEIKRIHEQIIEAMTPPARGIRGRTRSLVGAPSNNQGLLDDDSLKAIFSELPCPGFCLKKDDEPGKNLKSVYLFRWD